MTKDEFLVAVKLSTGIEMKPGQEYFFGDKIGIILINQFLEDGIIYRCFITKLKFRKPFLTRFVPYDQIMECVNNIREIIPDKIHHKWMIHP